MRYEKKEKKAMNIQAIETERLILRPFTDDDLEAFYTIFSNETINQFLPWYTVKNMEEAKQFYEERYAHSKDYNYAICLKEDNVPIGYIHITQDESHDFGYGLLDRYWRKGIVSEAARAVIEQAKKDGIPYITATHDVNNSHSGYVMKAVGMTYQYSYEELWQPKNFLVHFRMYQLNFDGSDYVFRKYSICYT